MLKQKITDEELEFMECWHTPRCLAESLFSNFNNLSEFHPDRFGEVRTYQIPFLSHEPIADENVTGLSNKQKFNIRKNVGDAYAFGGRNFGKTKVFHEIDINLSLLHDDSYSCCFTSVDMIHMDRVLDSVKEAMENHPIIKCWTKKNGTKKSPWRLKGKNGWNLIGANMGILSSNPGKSFYGLHVFKIFGEEMSLESQEVYEKRQDSVSELGAVMRLSGMTNFTRHSPAGKAFYNPENKGKIINLPQFVNPNYDKKTHENRLKEFAGEDTILFKTFVKGEVVEDGVSEFDTERISKCVNEKIEIKAFEITKEKFPRFKNIIITERPLNAERIFIAADIGESAGSEIIVISETKGIYTYLYNITLYNLTHLEQADIFDYLIKKLQANVVALDCGDGTGRAVKRELEQKYPKENLIHYDGSMKIAVDFEKDNEGNIKLEKGKPVNLEEFMSEWSVRRLKVLLYEQKMRLPLDYKMEQQFSSVMGFSSGSRTKYKCIAASDHLFDAFRVFAIAEWLCASHIQTPKMNTDWGIGQIG
jgi:hypothetical protein